MTNTTNRTTGGQGTSPEDIAVAAGMPRGSSATHSLHPAGDHRQPEAAGTLANAQARSTSAVDEARNAARGASDSAAGTAEGLKDRAAKIASQASETFNDAKDTALSAATGARDQVSKTANDYRDKASQAYDDARGWATDQRDTHRRRLNDGAERLRQGKSSVESFVTDNPLLVGVVGVAAGLLLGALLPRTRREDEAVGPWADEVRGQGLRYARDLTSKGREFVETALDPEAIKAAADRPASPTETAAPGNRPRTH